MSEVIDVRGRHLLRLADFTSAEILYLLDLAAELKAAKRWPRSEIVDLARSIANETGAKTDEVPSEAVEGCDVLLQTRRTKSIRPLWPRRAIRT